MIYFDNAATTPIAPEVLATFSDALARCYGNASSVHEKGREARAALEQARAEIASTIGARPKEIIFTSGGTEANNWALFGLAEAYKQKGNHIIATAIEHDSVLAPLRQLELKGFKVTCLPVNKAGIIDLQEFEKAITPETILLSVMYANNEIGSIQPITEIAKITKAKDIIFHSDICQAMAYLPINVQELGVDSATLNGGKIYGPKGVGALYVRENVKITPLFFGGGQEFRMRSGTENVPGIIAFAAAVKRITELKKQQATEVQKLRDHFIQELLTIPQVHLNGGLDHRLPNNVNICIEGVDNESLIIRLDMDGIAASAGSACSAGVCKPSHVLRALGLSILHVKNSIRLTLGYQSTLEEVNKTLELLKKLIPELRAVGMSPSHK